MSAQYFLCTLYDVLIDKKNAMFLTLSIADQYSVNFQSDYFMS